MSRLAWVDVFASGPMTGNPLAVVLDADDWPPGRMQGLAAELGISETAFAVAAEGGGDLRLRIFTPRRELPMAGHPVVGAAWVLRAAGRTGERAVLETGAGPLAVHARGDVATAELGRAVGGDEVDPGEAAAAAGVEPAAGASARIWSVGFPQLMLPVAGLAALRAARPDHGRLRALGERDGWMGVSLYATEDAGGRLLAHARHFAPRIGVDEDPVTGSAAGALGGHLASTAGPAGARLEMVVRQATALGRGGEVAVRVGADGAVSVGGRVVPLFEGRFVEP